MRTAILLISIIFLSSCSSKKLTQNNRQVVWVNGIKVSCMGVAPMQCLQIQKSETWVAGNWENFYSSIDGFDFLPGYIYKLLVKEEKMKTKNTPADASSLKYTLVEILEKTPDPKFRINDIWVLETINGEPVSFSNDNDYQEKPAIEIQLSEMRIMGNDGCNRFQGMITNIEEDKIAFGTLAGTMKMCMEMEIPDKFNKAMSNVKKYKTEGLKLIFFDEQDAELLRFKKVD